jgi:hypothetical protein
MVFFLHMNEFLSIAKEVLLFERVGLLLSYSIVIFNKKETETGLVRIISGGRFQGTLFPGDVSRGR